MSSKQITDLIHSKYGKMCGGVVIYEVHFDYLDSSYIKIELKL